MNIYVRGGNMCNGGRLPANAGVTNSDDEYVAAWREFARPICEVTGLVLYAFDPGIVLYRKSTNHVDDVDLPEWFVEKINIALKEQRLCSVCKLDVLKRTGVHDVNEFYTDEE